MSELTKVKGIGPKVAEDITEITGITTLAEFAAIDNATIVKIADGAYGSPEKISGWVKLAKGLVDVVEEVPEPLVEEVATPVEEVTDPVVEVEKVEVSENPVEPEAPVLPTPDEDNVTTSDLKPTVNTEPLVVNEKLTLDEWFIDKGVDMLERGFAQSSILVAAAKYFDQDRNTVLRKLDLNVSTRDNLLKAIKL